MLPQRRGRNNHPEPSRGRGGRCVVQHDAADYRRAADSAPADFRFLVRDHGSSHRQRYSGVRRLVPGSRRGRACHVRQFFAWSKPGRSGRAQAGHHGAGHGHHRRLYQHVDRCGRAGPDHRRHADPRPRRRHDLGHLDVEPARGRFGCAVAPGPPGLVAVRHQVGIDDQRAADRETGKRCSGYQPLGLWLWTPQSHRRTGYDARV